MSGAPGTVVRAVATTAAVLVAAALPNTVVEPAAAAGDVTIEAPASGGIIKAGDGMPFRLASDAGCADLSTRVVFADADGDAVVSGPASGGCEGVVAAPTLPAELEDANVAVAVIASRGGGDVAALPLNLRRKHGPHADSMSRDVAVEPTDDPRGGGTHLAGLGPDDTISFAGVDLGNISSVSFRIASGDRGGVRLELRADAPDGPLLGAVDRSGNTQDWFSSHAAGTGGWSQWTSVTAGVDPAVVPEGAFELFVVARAGSTTPPHPCTLPGVGSLPGLCRPLANLNHIEFNGHGVAEPWEFPPDGPGFEHIFDGESLDGWRMAGPGTFHLSGDGATCSEGGMGLLWYTERMYDDFVLRAEFKVRSYRDNSGIFVRFPDPGDDPWVAVDESYEIQIDDSFPPTQRTGAVYQFSEAHPLETNAVGEWNRLEITVVGQDYDVLLNGTQVTTYEGSRGLEGYVGLQNNDYFEGSEVCFRDIRVKDMPSQDMPSQPQNAEWEPNLVRERVYFRCADSPTQIDNTLEPSWSPDPPSRSFLSSSTPGAGCRMVDVGGQRDEGQGTTLDATWRGTFAGNLDTLNVDVHNLLLGPSRSTGALAVRVQLSVDGEQVLGDGGQGRRVLVVPQSANSGVTYRVRFSIVDIGLTSEDEDREHDVALTFSTAGGHQSVWVYDSTEVPSGILFNPGGGELEPTRVSAQGGGGGGGDNGAAPPGVVLAAQGAQSDGYTPATVVVSRGATLTFGNLDDPAHDVTSADQAPDGTRLFRSEVADNGSFVPVEGVEDLSPAEYGFFCSLHPNMTGELVVQ